MRSHSKRIQRLEQEPIMAGNSDGSICDFYDGMDEGYEWYPSEEEAARMMQNHRQSLKEHGLNANHHNETKYYE